MTATTAITQFRALETVTERRRFIREVNRRSDWTADDQAQLRAAGLITYALPGGEVDREGFGKTGNTREYKALDFEHGKPQTTSLTHIYKQQANYRLYGSSTMNRDYHI